MGRGQEVNRRDLLKRLLAAAAVAAVRDLTPPEDKERKKSYHFFGSGITEASRSSLRYVPETVFLRVQQPVWDIDKTRIIREATKDIYMTTIGAYSLL
jgi:hypothetical protein